MPNVGSSGGGQNPPQLRESDLHSVKRITTKLIITELGGREFADVPLTVLMPIAHAAILRGVLLFISVPFLILLMFFRLRSMATLTMGVWVHIVTNL